MHLKKSFWSDNQNEIKIKSFLKKNTNSVFIEFKLDSKNQKLKLGNLQNKIFLDAIFLNKKTKKESHFNLMNRFIFADAVFNFFNHLSFKKQLSKYKLDIKWKFNFELDSKSNLNKKLRNTVFRIYTSYYVFSKVK